MWWRGFYSSLLGILVAATAWSVAAQEATFLAVKCDPEAARLLPGEPAAARALLEKVAEEPSPVCLAAIGETYLLEGNDFWALRSLQGAYEALDADGAAFDKRRVAFLLCLGLTRTEQWDEASTYCAARAEDEASLRVMFDYYGGVAAFRAGDDVLAVSRLESAGWPAAFDASARRFMTLSIGRLAGVRPGPELTLGSSVGYDSNALMTPDDAASVGIVGDVAALKSAHWLQAGYRFRNVGRYVFLLRGSGYRSMHFAPLPESVNATDLGGSATVQRYGVVGQGKSAWEARYAYRVTFLDGGEATLEDDFFGFVESHSLSVGPSLWSAAGHGLSIRYALSHLRFAELVRNGPAHNLSIGEELRLSDELRLAVAQSGTFAHAGQPYQRWGASLGTHLSWLAAPAWTVRLRGTGIYEDYFNSKGYFDSADRRRDWSYAARLEAEWAFGGGFSLGAFCGAAGRHSSIESLTYDKWESGMQLQWNLGAR